MTYKESSEWNELNELRCLEIFQKLREENFPRGRQIDLCKKMARITNLEVGSISAKVSNYKSVGGINRASNASSNTMRLFSKFGELSAIQLGALIDWIKGGESVL
jgi:hypothetical protein